MDELEIEYFVQEDDTDGRGNRIGWVNWNCYPTAEEAIAAMNAMKPVEGSLRVVKTVTETLAIRER